ncbi:MAG: tyrosine-protein phosphatase [Erysipelotrichaceae bacterium]|nr:tyrosine-protein phosphatase [Erysipelotrichaceae bacterium]
MDQRFKDALNFRDLGGLESKDGRKVRCGFFFRGAGLAYFNEEELDEFKKLKVRTIMDLRSLAEIRTIPDPMIDGALYIQHNGLVVEGSEDIDWSPAGMRKIGGAAERQLEQIRGYYRTIAFNNEAYRIMLKEIWERHVPIYFHCMTGKDRTGVAAMIILMALGIKEEEIRKDYLLSNLYRKKILEESLADIETEAKGHPELKKLITIQDGVAEETFDTVVNAIIGKYGNYDRYLEEEYGLDKDKREKMKDFYLE